MKYLQKFSYLALLMAVALLLQGCNFSAETSSETKHTSELAYYTMDDFKLVKKIDIHTHINTEETTFIEQAMEDNFRFLDIIDDRPFGITMADQEKIAYKQLKAFPDQMFVAATFSVKNWGDDNWQKETIAHLKDSFAKGAIAVKIWKNIGMDLRDKDGTFVMVDDPRLDTIFNFLADNHIPVIGHNGEPKDCWLPLDQMTFSQGYYGSHPEYHMYLHPDYPSYEDQIMARDHMLENHPNLAFIGAHLGSIEWDLGELAKRLDKFPNMSVDLSRMPYLQLHAKNDWKGTHDFFIKYQDRLVYATDRAVNATKDAIGMKKKLHEAWLNDWKFYVTDEKITLYRYGALKGLKLPREVIDKIYLKNAERWFSGKI